MSRAFVKESDESARSDEMPERPQSPHTNYVTPTGLRQLQTRVVELDERRQRLLHAEDLASRQDLASVERDLRYYEERLRRAVLVEPVSGPCERVVFGTTVDVLDEDGCAKRFSIVGEDEADLSAGKVSYVSPLARALLNAQVGESVVWKRPSGDKDLEIAGIRAGDGA